MSTSTSSNTRSGSGVSTVSVLSQQLASASISDNSATLLQVAKTFLSANRDLIQDMISRPVALLPLFYAYFLPNECAELREDSVSLLLDRIDDQEDVSAYRRLLIGVARQNPSRFLEGPDGWNNNPEFQTIVGQQLIYYMGMHLTLIPDDHPAWELIRRELQTDNPLMTADWRELARECGVDVRAGDDQPRPQNATDFPAEACLSDLLSALHRIGHIALVETLAEEPNFFHLPAGEVRPFLSSPPDLSFTSSRPAAASPEPRALLPAESTMLHDGARRQKLFAMLAKVMAGGGKRMFFMNSLAIEEETWIDSREKCPRSVVQAATSMLELWFKDTDDFEPLVEHVLFACQQAGLIRLRKEVEALYPEAQGVQRSAHQDKESRRR